MATLRALINPDIEYGNPTDERMNIDTPTPPPIVRTTTKRVIKEYEQVCPEGKNYMGKASNGRPICASDLRLRIAEKQIAKNKAEEQGIAYTGQYTKDPSTGEIIPKPIEVVMQEKKNALVNEVKDATSGGDNLLKKYWWVLIAAGVGYLLLKKEN
jgi:hypothetical protein